MEKQFYKLDEYQGKLPNPRLFPIRGALITAVKGYPDTFTDGFMMDLSVRKKDRQRLEKLVERTTPNCSNLIENAKKTTILLSEPRYIFIGVEYITYVLFAPNIKPVAIQVKYYRYFRNHYPDCQFYTSDDWMAPKSVRLDNILVGLWMPVAIPPIEGE